MKAATYFAPPERMSPAEAKRQGTALRRDPGLRRLASSVPDLLAVLSPERQVIYANRQLQDFLDESSQEVICGQRPGELLGCIHAEGAPAGCGTARGCRYCGAARAILATQRTDQPSSEECIVTTGLEEGPRAYNFQVTTSPLEIGSTKYVLLCLRDISAEKHRQALQRIFFHDLLNTVSGLKMHLDLLKRQGGADACGDTIRRIERIGAQLTEEIRSQKLMVSAEARTLEVQRNLVSSRELAEELLESFASSLHPEVGGSPALELAPFYESASFISDEAILRRVLTNMVKNALEASGAGGTVTVGCRKEENGVSFSVHNPGHIAPAIQAQIFQRYFTTKGEGRGLGTYGMKLLAEEYLGGRVSFESTRTRGTTFTVWVPARGL